MRSTEEIQSELVTESGREHVKIYIEFIKKKKRVKLIINYKRTTVIILRKIKNSSTASSILNENKTKQS